ncbi:VanZ family protein [Saccharothrix sp. ALI-22-I]|uniref:VanZ family protein n=1 Tax=Saccharothrix sp. ALI-22-I TaxID=1933778 RepID=UPI0015C331E0|nr:VanZ family protein [Saccharothrix sp. ALI-22-I]
MLSFGDLSETVDRLLARPFVLPGLLLACVVFGVLAHFVARRYGWYRVPAVLAALSAALVFAVTLSRSRPDWSSMPGVIVQEEPFCYVNGFSAYGNFEMLNILMFVPFVFFAILATRRPFVVLGIAVATSAGIELVQTLTGQGVCETQDFLNNTVGIVAATAVTALVCKLLPAQRRSQPTA